MEEKDLLITILTSNVLILKNQIQQAEETAGRRHSEAELMELTLKEIHGAKAHLILTFAKVFGYQLK